jgi:hypothetical protein
MLKKLAFFFGACLCLWPDAHSLTLAEAKTELRRLVKDTATSTTLQRYSGTVLDSYLNQASRDVVTATWCLETSSAIALSSTTVYYDLPSDLIAVKMVTYLPATNQTRKLDQKSYKSQIESNPDWIRQTGPPMNYLVRASTDSGSALEIAFIPIPTASSTGTATVSYYKQATALTSDSDTLLDGDYTLVPYHNAIVYAAAVNIQLIEGNVAMAQAYSQILQSMITAMKSRLGELPDYSPGLSGAAAGSSTNR